MNTITIIIITVVGIALGYFLARRSRARESLIFGQAKRKQENKQKILDFLLENERVTNNEIEKLLGVSDATVTNYMDELEKEGKVEQVGKTGTGVFYRLK